PEFLSSFLTHPPFTFQPSTLISLHSSLITRHSSIKSDSRKPMSLDDGPDQEKPTIAPHPSPIRLRPAPGAHCGGDSDRLCLAESNGPAHERYSVRNACRADV